MNDNKIPTTQELNLIPGQKVLQSMVINELIRSTDRIVAQKILIYVASVGHVDDWAVYIGLVSAEWYNDSPDECIKQVATCGNKVTEELAQALFGNYPVSQLTYRP